MANPKTEFDLAPIPKRALVFFAVLVLLPVVLFAGIWAFDPAEFSTVPIWLLIVIGALGPLIVLYSMKGVHNPKLILDANGMQLKASFINKRWAISEMNGKAARCVDLETRDEWRPKWKLWGVALPGLSSGIFKLANGEKAHVYITERRNVVLIPTQSGSVLLSLQQPREFLKALQGL